MRERSKCVFAAAVAAIGVSLLVAAACARAESIAPGLWEIKVTVETKATAASMRRYEAQRKRLESLPPEQRKEVEASMPKPGVPFIHTERTCITPEEARAGSRFQGVEEDEDCRTVYGARKGGRISFESTCKEPPSSGKGEVVFDGPKAYSSTVNMKIRMPGEEPTESVYRTQHRWLAADCGSVKPDKD